MLSSLGEASRTLGEGFRAALGMSSERRGSGVGGGGSPRGSRKNSPSRYDSPRSPQGSMALEEESTEGAEQTLEVTVLARSTQVMPMDAP